MSQTVGDRIKAVRIKKELSVTKLAFIVQFDKSYISRLENGQAANPSAQFIDRFCESFSVDKAWLLTGKGAMDGDSHATQGAGILFSKEEAEASSKLDTLDESMQASVALRILLKDIPAHDLIKRMQTLLNAPEIGDRTKAFWVMCVLRSAVYDGESEAALFSATQKMMRKKVEALEPPAKH